jgi:hypothetical protein
MIWAESLIAIRRLVVMYATMGITQPVIAPDMPLWICKRLRDVAYGKVA